MVKTHYTGLKTTKLAKVGLMGPDGEEILNNNAYESVMLVTRFSQKYCALETLIDGLDHA